MQGQDPLLGFPLALFEARRQAVFASLGDGALVLPGAPVLFRSRDTEHRHRPDSELFYLTGVTDSESVAVLSGGAEPRFTLFVRERDEEAELWSGPFPGPEEAGELYRADETHPISEVGDRLPRLLESASAIYYRPGRSDPLDRWVMAAFAGARHRGQRKGTGPRSIVDPGDLLDELRLVKDSRELDKIRAAVAITSEGHRAAASSLAPGVGEWAIEAAVDAAFRSAGGTGPFFPTIVGAGANACVLHYVRNGSTVGPHDLVLVDAGAELDLYGGDVTRTLPAAGAFSDSQRAVYDLVESARSAAVSAVRPGARVADVHRAALVRIVEGLVDLGVLEGDAEDLIEQRAHKPFYPHQTSHWLGLDVHDPGDYARGGASRVLAPGMVLTVEPGLYFRPGRLEGTAERFAGVGVRIEDDVLVTDEGAEVLTAALPTAAAEVEAWVRDARGTGVGAG